jgi:predicted Rossmann fold flavoprotein
MRRIIIVGGGAAGLMAAIWAAAPQTDVLILERKATPGRKILISGGGRCNVLPADLRPDLFVTASSANSVKNILASWSLTAQKQFFEDTLGVPLKLEAESDKYFPVSDHAATILNALLNEAQRRGARLRVNASVENLTPDGDEWLLTLAGGDTLRADAVVLATGGLSVPATGSDGTGLRLLETLGHTINPLYPALTPLLTQNSKHHSLAGISKPVTLFAPKGDSIKKGAQRTRGFLFTHRGYSGPAIMDLSHHAVLANNPKVQPLWVQWTEIDAEGWESLLHNAAPTRLVFNLVRHYLPERLTELIVSEAGAMERTIATLRRDERQTLIRLLTRYPLPYSGNEGYQKAEVTGGGVALNEINPRTMESRLHAGLFLCGELLDAFGPIGGFNFAWAWVTGRLAGLGSAA